MSPNVDAAFMVMLTLSLEEVYRVAPTAVHSLAGAAFPS